jgi:polyhydroxybutyrate depolymerase
MRHTSLLLSAIAFALVLSASKPAPLAASQLGASTADRQSFTHNGVRRSYVVRIPDAVTKQGTRVPMVVVLHGGGGNAVNAEAMTGFTTKARQEGFIVVYPEGTSRGALGLLTWNASHCCGHAMQTRVDDVGFIGALIDQLVKDHPIDPKRIYATGLSNGGMMTHRLGIELSDRFAAIAPVIATLFGDEARPTRPVPALMINGMLDKSVPPEGGPPGGRFTGAWDGTPARPALDQAAFWARANGCVAAPDKAETAAAVVWRHRCEGSLAVTLYLVKNNGHAWPGGKAGTARGDTPATALNATDVIWEFFKGHTR